MLSNYQTQSLLENNSARGQRICFGDSFFPLLLWKGSLASRINIDWLMEALRALRVQFFSFVCHYLVVSQYLITAITVNHVHGTNERQAKQFCRSHTLDVDGRDIAKLSKPVKFNNIWVGKNNPCSETSKLVDEICMSESKGVRSGSVFIFLEIDCMEESYLIAQSHCFCA